MGRPPGTKNKKKSETEQPAIKTEETRATTTFEPFAEQSGEKKKVKERISVQLTEDGKLDTESMRTETLAKVRAFFQDPENQALLGANVKVDEVVSEKDVEMIFDLVGTIEGWGFSIIGKIDADIAARHAVWNEKQKELVVKPAQRVISKNAGNMTWFIRWKDEIVLGVIFIAISRAKFESARLEQKARNDWKASGGQVQEVPPENFTPVNDTKQ